MRTTNPTRVSEPQTSLRVDVEPFLTLLHQLDTPPGAPIGAGGAALIRQTIRVLTTSVIDPQVHSPVDMANLYADLHKLEDMFLATTSQPQDNE